jgi:ribosome maturation protein SDO1
MSRQLLPINQVRLTNVAVVRMNRGGRRFEIACYRNKVVNYRQGLETDLSEVLQTDRVFQNVSKGQFANSGDLEAVFGTRDETAICKIILERGALQVGDLERSQQLESTQRDVATWVANNCVHPTSQRPYTVPQIRDAMREAEFAVHPTRSVKRQYLDCIKLLQSKHILPIQRAKMQLQLLYPVEHRSQVNGALKALQLVPDEQTTNGTESQVVMMVDPSLYRDLDAIAKNANGRLEIIKQVVRQEGDVDLEQEMERKNEAKDALAAHQLSSLRIVDDEQDSANNDGVDHGPVHVVQDHVNNNVDEDGDHVLHASNSRQSQKKAQKKGKKGRRREKEEVLERQARLDAERQRQEERGGGDGVVMKHVVPSEEQQQKGQETTTTTSKSCNTCGGSFASAPLYRAHFRSDWHRYNIKLKLKGITPVSEQEFLLCDSNAFFEDL